MKKVVKITDPAKIKQASFAKEASVNRTAESGLDLRPVGSISSAVRVGASAPVLVFNSTNAVQYVRFGDASITSSSNPGLSIPISAGEKFMLNSGASEYIIASNAGVYAYVGDNT